jgi:hypothetical protein
MHLPLRGWAKKSIAYKEDRLNHDDHGDYKADDGQTMNQNP